VANRTIRFHLDEHVSHAVAAGLRRLGVDVTTTTDAGLLGADDAAQFAYGLAEGRVIFSQDDDFLLLASHGAAHAGLLYCAQNTRTVGQIIRALELVWEVYEPDEMRGRIEFV
jgi:predicted nuclease of predicted toxin-antitoxin system